MKILFLPHIKALLLIIVYIIQFETDPPENLCFRDQLGDETCGQESLRDCTLVAPDQMVYEFYGKEAASGSQSDINFWLRVTKGTGKLSFTFSLLPNPFKSCIFQ